MTANRATHNLHCDNDQHREEGGFETRPYESHIFFAYFAFFAVKCLVFFNCGSAGLAAALRLLAECAALFQFNQIAPVDHVGGFDRFGARVEGRDLVERRLQGGFVNFQSLLHR